MPNFYFHVHNDIDAEDPEGIHFSDYAEARRYGIKAVRELICDSVRKGHINLQHRIDIADDTASVIGTIRFADAIKIAG